MFKKGHSQGGGAISPGPKVVATINLMVLSALFNLPKSAISSMLHRKGLKASSIQDVVSFISFFFGGK